MKKNPTEVVERGRIVDDKDYGSPYNSGPEGAYIVPGPDGMLKIIASDGVDDVTEMFEHVSVSAPGRTPTWAEMQWVKEQFWEDEEVCFQVHPAKSQYVNCHPYCLHIWRHKLFAPPLPPSILVGPKEGGNQ